MVLGLKSEPYRGILADMQFAASEYNYEWLAR